MMSTIGQKLGPLPWYLDIQMIDYVTFGQNLLIEALAVCVIGGVFGAIDDRPKVY